ncbi:MAG TPA: hypothetical protein PKW14_08370 [Bacteroidota bacterium]|nr:hypothetical protein [Bacteroidota bacterium]
MKKLLLTLIAMFVVTSLSFSQNWPANNNGVLITKDVTASNQGILSATGTFKLDVAIPLSIETMVGNVDLGAFVQSTTPYTINSDELKWKITADNRYNFYMRIHQKEQNTTNGNKIEMQWRWDDGTPSSGVIDPTWLNQTLKCSDHDGWCYIFCKVIKVYANVPTTAASGPESFEQKIEVAYLF